MASKFNRNSSLPGIQLEARIASINQVRRYNLADYVHLYTYPTYSPGISYPDRKKSLPREMREGLPRVRVFGWSSPRGRASWADAANYSCHRDGAMQIHLITFGGFVFTRGSWGGRRLASRAPRVEGKRRATSSSSSLAACRSKKSDRRIVTNLISTLRGERNSFDLGRVEHLAIPSKFNQVGTERQVRLGAYLHT